MKYAKAIIAIIGAGITAALGIATPDTTLYQVLTIAAALVTAAAVYVVPNTDPSITNVSEPDDGPQHSA